MTDLEISKKLALAIGWDEGAITCYSVSGNVYVHYVKNCNGNAVRGQGYLFDYRDWNVVGPIAEWYDCFPWNAACGWISRTDVVSADTPQKAIALAVIQEAKK
jgi:hypothetical protein